jgi:hypothetical protein
MLPHERKKLIRREPSPLEDHDHRRRRRPVTDFQIPAPEAGDTSGGKSPSFSPRAKESASKHRERTVACGGDAPTPGDEISSQKLVSASCASAVTADVTESPEGAAEPDRPVGEPSSHMPTRAPAAVVSQHQAFPSFMRRYIDMAGSSGPQPRPLPAGFVPSIVRETGIVTTPITPSQAPGAASVTPAVTVAPVAGSICPTCRCRIPARLSAAERQRAYRKRKREKA